MNELIKTNLINQIYENNISCVKTMAQLLNTWDSYSDSEKYQLENITYSDSRINKHFSYKGGYNTNLVYEEVPKLEIPKLISAINKNILLNEKDVLVDIGSGSAKTLLNLSLSLPIRTFVGIEVQRERALYAKYITNKTYIENVFIINKNVLDFDLSMGNIFFMYDIYFDMDLCSNIFDKLPTGAHIISSKKTDKFKFVKDKFLLNGYIFYIYVK